ncbi:MAG: hypothetical protein FWD01_01605, partial [Defluviitaleaceae bacterium]|nr:hypothetical protein [Defluviitaleaceae bacterium]
MKLSRILVSLMAVIMIAVPVLASDHGYYRGLPLADPDVIQRIELTPEEAEEMMAIAERHSAIAHLPGIMEILDGDVDANTLHSIANMSVDEAALVGYDRVVLMARHAIVFNETAWTVDGAIQIIDEDGKIIYLPEFSDLFPNWDLAEISEANQALYLAQFRDASEQEQQNMANTRSSNWSGNINLPRFPESNMFYQWNASGRIVRIIAERLPLNSLINLGITNLNTGQDMGWIPNSSVGQGMQLQTQWNV